MKKTVSIICAVLVLTAGAFFLYKNVKSPNSNDGAIREPASSEGLAEQQQMIDQMNAKILSIQDRKQVQTVAKEIVAIASAPQAKSYPAVQMYLAVASVVPSLEGIIYRCRSFVEKSDWLHMSTLFGLRDFKYNNYLYGPHIDAIFDYLTYPSAAAGQPFNSVSELQDFLLFQIAPKLENFMKAAAELEKLPSENFEFQFDRTILVGQKNGLRFIDPEETRKLFIKPYFYTVTFLLQRALGTIYYVGAMDLDEMPVIYNQILKKTTMNNFAGNLRLSEPAKGVTPMMTYQTIQDSKSFLKWRKSIRSGDKTYEPQFFLDRAFYYGQVSAQNQLAAYVCGLKYPYLRSHGQIMQIQNKTAECSVLDQVGSVNSYFVTEGSKYLFNPNSMILNFKKKYNMFKDRTRAYYEAAQGKYATITSDVTGKSLQVNVKALFSAQVSPRDFLPTGYSPVPAASASTLPGVRAWNYEHGKPLQFRDYTFGGFFNSSQVHDTDSLYQAMSTLLYTDAVAPFGIFIRVPSTVRYFIPPSEIIRE